MRSLLLTLRRSNSRSRMPDPLTIVMEATTCEFLLSTSDFVYLPSEKVNFHHRVSKKVPRLENLAFLDWVVRPKVCRPLVTNLQ